jgi:NTE family protein
MKVADSKERAYVAFQGGGALGVAHFGAWQAIAKEYEIVGVAGTSSGSIVAALCAAGVSPKHTFESFKRNLPVFVGHNSFLWSMIDIICRFLFGRDASNDGSCFQSWLEEQLEQSDLERGITFKELFERKGIYLQVVACDLKDENHPVVYSPDERKGTSISRAVRASISLPGLFKTIRIGNRELVDGGLKLNFPIETLYQRAKTDNCVLIGVRFKKSPRSFNSSKMRQVFSKSYELVMSNSSPVSDEIKKYSKCEIIEIDDRGLNPLNFNLSKDQLIELREAGREAAEEQLEELQKKLNKIKSRLLAQLPSGTRESVIQAQGWFNHEVIPKIEEYCKVILRQDEFSDLTENECEVQDFYREIEKYLKRISESLLDQNFDLLKGRLSLPSLSNVGIHLENLNIITLSLPNLNVYLEVLELIKRDIPDYLSAKQGIRERIDCLKTTITQQFRSL